MATDKASFVARIIVGVVENKKSWRGDTAARRKAFSNAAGSGNVRHAALESASYAL